VNTGQIYANQADAPVVVIMSGGGASSTAKTLEDATKLGVKYTLAKPFGMDEMLAVVEKALAEG